MIKILIILLFTIPNAYSQNTSPLNSHSKAIQFEIDLKQEYLESIFDRWKMEPLDGSRAVHQFTQERFPSLEVGYRNDAETGVYMPVWGLAGGVSMYNPSVILYNLVSPRKIRNPPVPSYASDTREEYVAALSKIDPFKFMGDVVQLMKLKYALEEEINLFTLANMIDSKEHRVHVILTADHSKKGVVEKYFLFDRKQGIVNGLVVFIYVDSRRLNRESFEEEREYLRDKIIHNPLGVPNVHWPEELPKGQTFPTVSFRFHNQYVYRYWESLLQEYDINLKSVNLEPFELVSNFPGLIDFEYEENQRSLMKAALEKAAYLAAMAIVDWRSVRKELDVPKIRVRLEDLHKSHRGFRAHSTHIGLEGIKGPPQVDPVRERSGIVYETRITVKFWNGQQVRKQSIRERQKR